MVYFSDIFNVDESILESYGAMNISLLNDIPLLKAATAFVQG